MKQLLLRSGETAAEVPPADSVEEADNVAQNETSASLLVPDSLVAVQPEPLIPGGLNFLVVGAPLSGKSTQTHLLAERYDIPAITIDDLLLVRLCYIITGSADLVHWQAVITILVNKQQLCACMVEWKPNDGCK